MKKINEIFVCTGCGKTVPLAQGTCRNHCSWCFTSLHVDGDIPGDRATHCHGVMLPTMYERKNGTIKICFQCLKCGKIHRNKKADDDDLSALDQKIQEYKIRLMIG